MSIIATPTTTTTTTSTSHHLPPPPSTTRHRTPTPTQDALELTGHVIGRDNRCARRGLRDWKDARELPEVAGRPLSGALGPGGYSDLTLRSLYMADEEQVGGLGADV